MDDDATPAVLRLNTQLGPAPTRADVDALMKRCQVGVGGRNALDDAHSIMAECYGTLGRQQLEIERLRGALTAIGMQCAADAQGGEWTTSISRVQALVKTGLEA